MKANFYLLFLAITLSVSPTFGQTETIQQGSFIINMGITPQTVANGLKPYGLLYDLMKNHKVPVWWIINPSKAKDGADFIHNGITYRGGTFVIPAPFRTAAVNTVIANWQSQGVVGATSISNFTAPVYMKFKFTPRWTLDKLYGHIITNFFVNAGIPASAHGGSSPAGWKLPSQLDACDDIFVMPHAEPTWETHGNLYYWNQVHKGNIWSGCHSPSSVENITSPGGVRMNFLTTNGMVPHKQHQRDGTPPYTYTSPTSPIMQFMNIMDGALTNGSEQAFLPSLTSAWRSTTTIGGYDADHPDIPSKSNGLAAVLAFGRAFGDTTRGFVMYEAGHDITTDGTVAEMVAAQRAFFNYSYFIMTKTYDFDINMYGLPEITLVNQEYPLGFTVPPHINLSLYTIKWTSTNGGIFSPNDHSQNVTFKPTDMPGQNTIVSVTLTDACGRQYVSSSTTYSMGVLDAGIRLNTLRKSQSDVELSWAISSKEASHVEIQKQEHSIFKPVAIVTTDESSSKKTYKYTDKNVQSPLVYYRLKIVSTSGIITYSNIEKLTMDNGPVQPVLLRNPVLHSIRLFYESPLRERVTLRMVSIQGQTVLSRNVMAGEDNILVADLPPGLVKGHYIVQLISSQKTYSFKVLVQ